MSSVSVYSAPARTQSISRVLVRPTLDRMPSTMSDVSTTSAPVATNSVINKAASASSSIYQTCVTIISKLRRLPGYAEAFLDIDQDESDAAAGPLPNGGAYGASDPVSKCLLSFRLGSSLCSLYNALGHGPPLDVNPSCSLSHIKACQKGTAHFIMALKQNLRWSDSDLFSVSDLYTQDTNGMIKVIHTVTQLLAMLEEYGLLDPPTALQSMEAGPLGPVSELLDSERKYVQDLEVLQDYQRQLQQNDVLTADQIANLFLNLNKLADFQRRFLIGVEANASLKPELQRFGLLFIQMESEFVVYEPYCTNLDSANALAVAELDNLAKMAHVLDAYDLLQMLIKPVQRICKYPLLVQALVKHSNPDSPYYDELLAGMTAMQRVAEKVNEMKRTKDNEQARDDLIRRVEDWKGHDIDLFGTLLLHETFFVIKNETEREYSVYLFDKIILCCKESGVTGKKSSKSNSILKKPTQKRLTMLQLKGRIFVNNVSSAVAVVRTSHSEFSSLVSSTALVLTYQLAADQFLLEVKWRGDLTGGEEAFTIKCRTEELLNRWQPTIARAVAAAGAPRRVRSQQQLSNGRRVGFNSPLSQFPGTPVSEVASVYSYQSEAWGASTVHPNAFDDEADDVYDPESGRSTPLNGTRRGMGTRSLPPEERERLDRLAGRPRAQTDDSNGPLSNQWRGQGPVPSLPRGASMVNGSEAPYHSNASSTSLRSSGSGRQLRTQQSTEWGSANPSMPQARANGYPMPYDEEQTPRPAQPPRTSNQPALPIHPAQLRNRSASSPNMYQVPQLPPHEEWSSYPELQHRVNGAGDVYNMSAVAPLSISQKNGPTSSSTTIASASSAGAAKRFSSSSNGTDRSSGTSSQSQGQAYSAATSPASTLPNSATSTMRMSQNGRNGSHDSQPIAAPCAAIKVKVSFGEDTFVIVVLSSIGYSELVEKVLKKIRLCGDRTKMDANNLHLRYEDEDKDRIIVNDGEDLQMAFDSARTAGTLTLFAD